MMRSRATRPCGVVLALCLLAEATRAQTPPSAPQPTATVLSADEVARRVADISLPVAQRDRAYSNIDRMSRPEQEKALFLIVNGPNASMAGQAARRLIRNNTGAPSVVARLIGDRMQGWSERDKDGVLELIAKKVRPEAPFLELARTFLRSALATGGSGAPETGRPVEAAALALALNGDPGDAEVIRVATRRSPRSPTLWYAVAGSGGAVGSDLDLARSIYRDSSAPMPLRLGAATAVAGRDPDAAALVTSRLERGFAALADKDEQALYVLYGLHGQVKTLKEFGEVGMRVSAKMLAELDVLPALRFLPTPAAESFTRTGLDAVNEFIRTASGVVAAMRWPNLLIEKRPARIPDVEYERLLAILVLRHPEFASKVEAALGRPLSDDAKHRALRGGLGGFGRAGTYVHAFGLAAAAGGDEISACAREERTA